MRSNLTRNCLLFLAVSVWVFMLLALGSFHPTDWPSHSVYPYPAIANLCGPVGAWVAYICFKFLGQGVFPILFFTGVCIALVIHQNYVSDLWLRAIGLLLLSCAFAATVHHFKPGSQSGLPEGNGGIVGIGMSVYLQSHFSTIGTDLVLLSTILLGLLLAADDLVLRAPGAIAMAASSVRSAAESVKQAAPQAPKIPWNFLKLPDLSFIGRLADGLNPRSWMPAAKSSKTKTPISRFPAPDEDFDSDDGDVILKRRKQSGDEREGADFVESQDGNDPWGAGEEPELEFPLDEPAGAEIGHEDDSHPSPAEAAEVPPESEQAVALPPRADIVVKLPNMIKPRQSSPPPQPPKELGEYHLPPWDLLAEADHSYAEGQEKFVREMAAVLEAALKEFNVDAQVVEIDTGPVITMYELSLAPGLKVSAITSLTNDIMRALKAESVRIVAPVPGKNTVGIEVPNEQKEKVRFKELLQLAPDAMAKDFVMPLFLGKDASGEPLIVDLVRMPHCLIAGTTGSGKSVCINTIIMSIMYLQRPDRVKLILVDPKVVEMAPFKDVPHLMCPVINDTGRAASVLEWACEKMDERYEFLAEAGVRNIKDYNTMTQEELIERFQPGSPEEEAKIPKHLPYIVIIIDELADLMMTSESKDTEGFIVRIAQKARAVGIHLILATQRPAATVVTGLIKSNMPTRISFRVQSRMDSRIIMDQNGAELLLGQGDMLLMANGASKPIRGQGTFIDDKEIRDSVKLVRSQAEAQYEPELVQIKASLSADGDFEKDELYEDAVQVVLETRRGSVSLLQRRLTIGYARASRLIEQMAATGIVGEYKGAQAREALLTLEEWEAAKAQQQSDANDGMSV